MIFRKLYLLIVFLVTLLGCSRGPQFADVEGKITLNGKPLTDVEVVFLPDPETGTLGPASSSYTDAKGHYRLRTHKGQSGAVIGTHRVYIRDLTALPLPPLLDPEATAKRTGPRAPKPPRVPPRYGSPKDTPLAAVEVKPGGQTLNFELGGEKRK